MRQLLLFCFFVGAVPAQAQTRPDFSGIWRIIPAESRMVSGGSVTTPPDDYHLTWLIDHREPDIAVSVNLRRPDSDHEWSFRCTLDGSECTNELASLGEVRRISATWQGDTLVMTQHASTPYGAFNALDRLTLADSGRRLVFDRIVTNARGERAIRQVFTRLGPHPSQRAVQDPLPSVDLPPDLSRVLRDYERYWRGGNADSLAALFTDDGLIARRGWVRGRDRLRESLQGTSSDLRLRAVAYDAGDRVAYIVGAYRYGEGAGNSDSGIFLLTLRRGPSGGLWLIAADLDSSLSR